MHVEIAAVVQRLVHLIAIQMMTVRFRSVAPICYELVDIQYRLFFFGNVKALGFTLLGFCVIICVD